MFKPSQRFSALQQAAYQLSSCTDQIFQRIEQEQILDSIVDHIRSYFKLEDIFKATSTSIRQLLNADRVGVFRFTPDSGWDEGEFVAEDVAAEYPSAMEAKVYDHCFGSQFAVYYSQGRVQAVEDIYNAELSDCHIDILEQFQVRANLIVPVLKEKELWGLLCIHQCAHPRRWQLAEIEFVRKIADHFSIALQQAEHLEKLKQQATLPVQAAAQKKALLRQKALVKIVSKIRQFLDFNEICQTASEEVRKLLEVERVAIYRFNPDWSGNFLFESVAEEWKPLVGVSPTIEDTCLMETRGGRYANNETCAVADIYTVGHSDCHIALLEDFQVRAYAIAPIFQEKQLWGLLAAFQNSAPRDWQTDEVELLAQLGEQLGIALQQTKSVQKIKTQSTELKQLLKELKQSQLQLEAYSQTLEEQVEQRTRELKAVQQQMIAQEKLASLGSLTAGVAHELRNPLNFVTNYAEGSVEMGKELIEKFQEQNYPPSEEDWNYFQETIIEIKENAGAIHKHGQRAESIIYNMMQHSRCDDSSTQATEINKLLDEARQLSYHSRRSRDNSFNITFTTEYDESIGKLQVFSASLNRAFINLIDNGCYAAWKKYVENGQKVLPQLWITTKNLGKEIEIRIRDNGQGIPDKVKERIFEPFFTTKPTGEGTGLGLSLTHEIIVGQHRGILRVETKPDNFTEFILTLPKIID